MRHLAPPALAALVLAFGGVPALPRPEARGQDPAAARAERTESLVTGDGRRVAGRLDVRGPGGPRFLPGDGTEPIPLVRGQEVQFEGGEVEPTAGLPPFHALMGLDQRLSGRLAGLDATTIRLDDGPGHRPIRLARAGVVALMQRPGEVQVLSDGFEAIDRARWSGQTGEPELANAPKLVGSRSLKLPAGGSSLTCRLPEPVASGRLEVAYLDDGRRVPHQSWFVDLTFRQRGTELGTIRAVLGWAEETLAVESPGGPSLAVQPLARRPGWHRLSVRFGPEGTDLAVDGDELAHGSPAGGELVELRLATHSLDGSEPPERLAAYLDDLRLARLVEPAGRMQVVPAQDEVRLITGDQVFGRIASADAEGVRIEVLDEPVPYAWSEVAGLRFRRDPRPSDLLDGLLVRLEWRSAPGLAARDADAAEGVLAAVDDEDLTLRTPYAGTLLVPRARARRLRVLGPTRRIVLDPTPHHLGSRFDADLEPPQAEGGTLELPFTLDALPGGRASLALDVVQVVGETGNPDFSPEVKAGFLRTSARLNGQAVDDLNRHIDSRNETPERIRLPIPPGLLRAGPNVLSLTQTGRKNEPESFDNLGVLGIALEFDAEPPEPGPKP